MARKANELSAIQRNKSAFNSLKARLDNFTPDYLAELGSVSRTTIFKYKRRGPINPSSEQEIINVLVMAETIKSRENETKLNRILAEKTAYDYAAST